MAQVDHPLLEPHRELLHLAFHQLWLEERKAVDKADATAKLKTNAQLDHRDPKASKENLARQDNLD